MNRQDIIDMIAKVYGVAWANEAQLKDLEKFAALVAVAEREACAVMVEEQQRMAKRIEELEAILERQTARIVDLQAHIENFEGEDR